MFRCCLEKKKQREVFSGYIKCEANSVTNAGYLYIINVQTKEKRVSQRRSWYLQRQPLHLSILAAMEPISKSNVRSEENSYDEVSSVNRQISRIRRKGKRKYILPQEMRAALTLETDFEDRGSLKDQRCKIHCRNDKFFDDKRKRIMCLPVLKAWTALSKPPIPEPAYIAQGIITSLETELYAKSKKSTSVLYKRPRNVMPDNTRRKTQKPTNIELQIGKQIDIRGLR